MKANKYKDHMSCLTFHFSIQYEMNNVSIRSRNESTEPSSF